MVLVFLFGAHAGSMTSVRHFFSFISLSVMALSLTDSCSVCCIARAVLCDLASRESGQWIVHVLMEEVVHCFCAAARFAVGLASFVCRIAVASEYQLTGWHVCCAPM